MANPFHAPRGTPSARIVAIAIALVAASAACTDVDRKGGKPDPISGFGAPCTSDETCTDKACVPHMGTTVCSQSCDASHPCPTDWSCWVAPSNDPSAADGATRSYCVSPEWALCRPCDADVDCALVGAGHAGNCVDYASQGAFCGGSCETSTDCPEGYLCDDVTTTAGRTTRACVHASGFCPCTPYLAALGAPVHCHRDNEFGSCTGARTCDSKSWSPCNAAEPAPETPNLVDDDCDGFTDEDACFCGDAQCDTKCGETLANCPCDCASNGDGVCSPCGENPAQNPDDCCRTQSGAGSCGDGYCLGYGCGENPTTCPQDCSTPCGNGQCEAGENPSICPEDCKHQVCGNHVCEPTDGGPVGCPGDCLPTCGDCICDPVRDESVHNCPIDCGFCGDDVCSTCTLLHENPQTCAHDCCVPSPEACNGGDDDCDGETDEENSQGCVSYYRDVDGDSLGDAATERCLCGPEANYTTRATGDCDDQSEAVGRGPAESCNALDDDCDGETDEDFALGAACPAPSGACWDGTVACDGPDRTACDDLAPSPEGTLCAPVACADGLVRPAATCDDAGSCVLMPWAACNGYTCDPAGRCGNHCETTADCRTGFACGVEHNCEQVAPDCIDDAHCVDQDWQTVDLCLVVCGHPPRDDAGPGGDVDGDGVLNGVDDCPETKDPLQVDSDHDGRGDACDACDGPSGVEVCNSLDDDCDGETDEGFAIGLTCVDANNACMLGKVACGLDQKAVCVGDHPASVGFACGDIHCENGDLRLAGACQVDGTCGRGQLMACNGYRCSEVPGAPDVCETSCGDDSHCAPDYTCVGTPSGGRCAPKKSNGESCGKDGDCYHGHCVDRVCCDTACAQTCFTCGGTNATARGTCGPVGTGTDPDNDCGACATCDALGACAPVDAGTNPKELCMSDHSACGQTGTCDGDGACAVHAVNSPCGPVSCLDAQLVDPGVCDGQGGCTGSASSDCPGNFACAVGGATCRATCSSDRHCAEGYFCDTQPGLCVAERALGVGCAGDGECASGHCIDGVCCDTGCDGTCLTCIKADNIGHCAAIQTGTDPNNDCSLCSVCNGQGGCKLAPQNSDPANDCGSEDGCGQTGACDGTGQCAFQAATTQCAAASCVGASLLAPRNCDGKGNCGPAVLTACTGYRCDEAGLACRTACTTDGQCQSGFYCTATVVSGQTIPGQCRLREQPGVGCARNFACQSGFCADGVCCNAACDDLCESCAVEGHHGTCTALDGVSDGACTGAFVCRAGTCAQVAGTDCTGNDECASRHCEADVCCTTECAGPCQNCATGACTTVRLAQNGERCGGSQWCDNAGACVAIGGSACGPGAACPEGWGCVHGVCAAPLALGVLCDADAACGSGHCVDGVCCDGACEGSCQACGQDGHCAAAPVGSSDPACVDGLVCGVSGTCGTASGAACPAVPGACASGQCVDGVCCGSACAGTCATCTTGTCQAVADGKSDPGTCNAPSVCLGGACATASTCTTDDNCVVTHQCFALGNDAGICCNEDCGGRCQTCISTIGTCTPVQSAENPTRCQGTEWCDATGTCVVKASQACSGAVGCASGFYCDNTGHCAAAAALGTHCDGNASCASGFCADGVCCESACTGACRYCANVGSLGTCLAAPTGTDPGGDCAAGQTCSREAGACRAANGQACGDSDAACASGQCTDGVCCASACDGACQTCAASGTRGTCTTVRSGDDDACQGPLTCDAAGACLLAAGMPCQLGSECESASCTLGVCCPHGCSGQCQACMPDGQCANVLADENPGRCEAAEGQWCNANGSCVAVVPDGHDCDEASDCTSGFCVDHVCCAEACDGTCEACDIPGRLGSCERAEAGSDPHETCPAGQICNAAGACALDDGNDCTSDAQCGSGHCVDHVCCESACDGTCEACDSVAARGECRPVVNASDADSCMAPWTCGPSGTCLIATGQPCGGDTQCASGQCENAAGASGVDFRVCCQTNCDGTCENCAAGTGLCSDLTRVEDVGLCVDPSWCDGRGDCSPKAAAKCTTGDAECPSGMYCDTVVGGGGQRSCLPKGDGGDSCTANGQCTSGNCASGHCCDAGCGAPFTCDAGGVCGLPDGLPCASGDACISGLCIDNVCCASACGGTCMACDTAEKPGTCVPMTGTDDTCAGYCSNGMCTPGVACDAGRPCANPSVCVEGMCVPGGLASGTGCVANAQCSKGICTDGVCCETTCSGACLTCDGTSGGMRGFCAPVSAGPDEECFGGTMGMCVGGTCLGSTGAACRLGSDCVSGVCDREVCGVVASDADAGAQLPGESATSDP